MRMAELLDAEITDDRILCIAASGSLGRMEQVATSDGDLLVVMRGDGQCGADAIALRELVERVWETLGPLQLPLPDPRGIFALATTEQELLDESTLGQMDESPRSFGHRIQLLLDAQPVWGLKDFNDLAHRSLVRYASGDVWPSVPSWDYLRNDLIRYYRCLANDAIWRRRDQPSAWRHFQLKLLHSRRLIYAGLMTLLSESTCSQRDPVAWLVRALRLTPLERLAIVPDDSGAWTTVAATYDRFLRSMHDEQFRAALAETGGDSGAAPDLMANAAFEELIENSRELQQGVAELWQQQLGRWDDRTLLGLML